jgi:hypothetical protein
MRLICDEDLRVRLKAYTVSGIKDHYPFITVKGKVVYLHHLILPPKKGFDVDHINRNKWDCRRSNLRYLTHSNNLHNSKIFSTNTSGFRGVSRLTNAVRWAGCVCIEGKKYRKATFLNALEAHEWCESIRSKYLPKGDG